METRLKRLTFRLVASRRRQLVLASILTTLMIAFYRICEIMIFLYGFKQKTPLPDVESVSYNTDAPHECKFTFGFPGALSPVKISISDIQGSVFVSTAPTAAVAEECRDRSEEGTGRLFEFMASNFSFNKGEKLGTDIYLRLRSVNHQLLVDSVPRGIFRARFSVLIRARFCYLPLYYRIEKETVFSFPATGENSITLARLREFFSVSASRLGGPGESNRVGLFLSVNIREIVGELRKRISSLENCRWYIFCGEAEFVTDLPFLSDLRLHSFQCNSPVYPALTVTACVHTENALFTDFIFGLISGSGASVSLLQVIQSDRRQFVFSKPLYLGRAARDSSESVAPESINILDDIMVDDRVVDKNHVLAVYITKKSPVLSYLSALRMLLTGTTVELSCRGVLGSIFKAKIFTVPFGTVADATRAAEAAAGSPFRTGQYVDPEMDELDGSFDLLEPLNRNKNRSDFELQCFIELDTLRLLPTVAMMGDPPLTFEIFSEDSILALFNGFSLVFSRGEAAVFLAHMSRMLILHTFDAPADHKHDRRDQVTTVTFNHDIHSDPVRSNRMRYFASGSMFGPRGASMTPFVLPKLHVDFASKVLLATFTTAGSCFYYDMDTGACALELNISGTLDVREFDPPGDKSDCVMTIFEREAEIGLKGAFQETFTLDTLLSARNFLAETANGSSAARRAEHVPLTVCEDDVASELLSKMSTEVNLSLYSVPKSDPFVPIFLPSELSYLRTVHTAEIELIAHGTQIDDVATLLSRAHSAFNRRLYMLKVNRLPVKPGLYFRNRITLHDVRLVFDLKKSAIEGGSGDWLRPDDDLSAKSGQRAASPLWQFLKSTFSLKALETPARSPPTTKNTAGAVKYEQPGIFGISSPHATLGCDLYDQKTFVYISEPAKLNLSLNPLKLVDNLDAEIHVDQHTADAGLFPASTLLGMLFNRLFFTELKESEDPRKRPVCSTMRLDGQISADYHDGSTTVSGHISVFLMRYVSVVMEIFDFSNIHRLGLSLVLCPEPDALPQFSSLSLLLEPSGPDAIVKQYQKCDMAETFWNANSFFLDDLSKLISTGMVPSHCCPCRTLEDAISNECANSNCPFNRFMNLQYHTVVGSGIGLWSPMTIGSDTREYARMKFASFKISFEAKIDTSFRPAKLVLATHVNDTSSFQSIPLQTVKRRLYQAIRSSYSMSRGLRYFNFQEHFSREFPNIDMPSMERVFAAFSNKKAYFMARLHHIVSTSPLLSLYFDDVITDQNKLTIAVSLFSETFNKLLTEVTSGAISSIPTFQFLPSFVRTNISIAVPKLAHLKLASWTFLAAHSAQVQLQNKYKMCYQAIDERRTQKRRRLYRRSKLPPVTEKKQPSPAAPATSTTPTKSGTDDTVQLDAVLAAYSSFPGTELQDALTAKKLYSCAIMDELFDLVPEVFKPNSFEYAPKLRYRASELRDGLLEGVSPYGYTLGLRHAVSPTSKQAVPFTKGNRKTQPGDITVRDAVVMGDCDLSSSPLTETAREYAHILRCKHSPSVEAAVGKKLVSGHSHQPVKVTLTLEFPLTKLESGSAAPHDRFFKVPFAGLPRMFDRKLQLVPSKPRNKPKFEDGHVEVWHFAKELTDVFRSRYVNEYVVPVPWILRTISKTDFSVDMHLPFRVNILNEQTVVLSAIVLGCNVFSTRLCSQLADPAVLDYGYTFSLLFRNSKFTANHKGADKAARKNTSTQSMELTAFDLSPKDKAVVLWMKMPYAFIVNIFGNIFHTSSLPSIVRLIFRWFVLEETTVTDGGTTRAVLGRPIEEYSIMKAYRPYDAAARGRGHLLPFFNDEGWTLYRDFCFGDEFDGLILSIIQRKYDKVTTIADSCFTTILMIWDAASNCFIMIKDSPLVQGAIRLLIGAKDGTLAAYNTVAEYATDKAQAARGYIKSAGVAASNRCALIHDKLVEWLSYLAWSTPQNSGKAAVQAGEEGPTGVAVDGNENVEAVVIPNEDEGWHVYSYVTTGMKNAASRVCDLLWPPQQDAAQEQGVLQENERDVSENIGQDAPTTSANVNILGGQKIQIPDTQQQTEIVIANGPKTGFMRVIVVGGTHMVGGALSRGKEAATSALGGGKRVITDASKYLWDELWKLVWETGGAPEQQGQVHHNQNTDQSSPTVAT